MTLGTDLAGVMTTAKSTFSGASLTLGKHVNPEITLCFGLIGRIEPRKERSKFAITEAPTLPGVSVRADHGDTARLKEDVEPAELRHEAIFS